MPVPRTEAQIISQAPIKLTFGEKVFDVKPLRMGKNLEWKEKLTNEFGDIIKTFEEPAGVNNLLSGLTLALMRMPEKLAKLVFEYAPYLPKNEIMELATDEQLSQAFSEIMQVAYPFLAQLGMIRQVVAIEQSQRKQNSTNYVS